MDIQDWLRSIESQLDFDQKLVQVEKAIAEYPDYYELRIMKGDLIQLADNEKYSVFDAEAEYTNAVRIDANRYEAYESLGYYCYSIMDNDELAEMYFHTSLEKQINYGAAIGIAKIQLDAGNVHEAIEYLRGINSQLRSRVIDEFVAEIL